MTVICVCLSVFIFAGILIEYLERYDARAGGCMKPRRRKARKKEEDG